jgi:signal recognition particle receptor subunit beta
MVLFNYSTKELTAKVVYYGPGLCGKTTNLQWIHEKLPIKNKGKMVSLATEADRTLFFDFLPIELGTIRGMKTRIQLYTVPGQVFYNATRRMVLKGADCVVFVVDSQEAMIDANLDALANLRENLEANDIDPDQIPVVIQYNKRDLPNAAPVATLQDRLNPKGWLHFEACAKDGVGVEETLKGVTGLVFRHLATRYGGAQDAAAAAPRTTRPVAPVPPPAPPPPPPAPPSPAPGPFAAASTDDLLSSIGGPVPGPPPVPAEELDLGLGGNMDLDLEPPLPPPAAPAAEPELPLLEELALPDATTEPGLEPIPEAETPSVPEIPIEDLRPADGELSLEDLGSELEAPRPEPEPITLPGLGPAPEPEPPPAAEPPSPLDDLGMELDLGEPTPLPADELPVEAPAPPPASAGARAAAPPPPSAATAAPVTVRVDGLPARAVVTLPVNVVVGGGKTRIDLEVRLTLNLDTPRR